LVGLAWFSIIRGLLEAAIQAATKGPSDELVSRLLSMLMRAAFQLLLFVATAAASSIGCTPEAHRYIRFPDLAHPGWAHEQRGQAIEHDPYPVDDAGPEVVGGRPREYQRPLNEVERARMKAPPPIALQPIPVPSFPATPPVVTTPYPPTSLPPVPIQVQPRTPY
jgi:hypothetical protein